MDAEIVREDSKLYLVLRFEDGKIHRVEIVQWFGYDVEFVTTSKWQSFVDDYRATSVRLRQY